MKHISLAIILCLMNLTTLAQNKEADKVNFETSIDWLDSKLNYTYYDEAGGKWWKNTFYINESNEVTIKHISSSKPITAKIKDKTYTVRKFRLSDINPRSLKIKKVDRSGGRIVNGEMLELRTYNFEDQIQKSINNRRASSTSFLYLSFPKYLTDSLADYASLVKEKLALAIESHIALYSSGSIEEDRQTLFHSLEGDFISESGEKITIRNEFGHVFSVNRDNESQEFLGFDTAKRQLYYLSIDKQRVELSYFKPTLQETIVWSDPNDKSIMLHSLHSFSLRGVRYYRM